MLCVLYSNYGLLCRTPLRRCGEKTGINPPLYTLSKRGSRVNAWFSHVDVYCERLGNFRACIYMGAFLSYTSLLFACSSVAFSFHSKIYLSYFLCTALPCGPYAPPKKACRRRLRLPVCEYPEESDILPHRSQCLAIRIGRGLMNPLLLYSSSRLQAKNQVQLDILRCH